MIDHAFTGLGLHRIALTVFAFNERAIRSYRQVGFVVEGRAREAIWREGRWWDEIAMSILDSGLDGAHPRPTITEPVTEPEGSEAPAKGRRVGAVAGFLGRRR
jgi:hypothetical protein